MIYKNKGQSLVELIFSIAIIVLVLSGVVILVINVLGSRTKTFDRKRASRLAELITEQLTDQKKNDPINFWNLSPLEGLTNPGLDYNGYSYSVGFTNITTGGCGVGITDCAEAVLSIGWSGKVNQTLIFNRFFTRK